MPASTEEINDESFPPNQNHHVGQPPTRFTNPWPSFRDTTSLLNIFKTRFSSDRNFVPIPESRDELVSVRTPDWGASADPHGQKLKATWIGHASWLVEFPRTPPVKSADPDESSEAPGRGVRVLFDPVFSERTSPFSFIGPKRYSPTPCSLKELPEVDIVAISHNHYDHLDYETIKYIQTRSSRTVFACPLGNGPWFEGIGISAYRVVQLDWWQGVDVAVQGLGSIRLVCTPAQHVSARGINDKTHTLWSSWAAGSLPDGSAQSSSTRTPTGRTIEATLCQIPKSLSEARSSPIFGSSRVYFAGDTGYRSIDKRDPTPEEVAHYPRCPAFKTTGLLMGPFDIGLIPIGLYTPRDVMSSVHVAPEDSALLIKDVDVKYAVGMHYGTFRGGLSQYYEDVRDPPRRFKKACEYEGLEWGVRAGLCDIGETVVAP